jgi:hypothetical protein
MYLAYPSAAASKDFEEPVGDKFPSLKTLRCVLAGLLHSRL